MTTRLSWTLVALLCAAPIVGQDEAKPYFALHSEKTFAPGEPPSIGLSATQIPSLNFRVYRIKDAVKFFQQLEDPHMFGGQAPKPPREKTPLEKFHAAKLHWHAAIRDLFRAQFTSTSRQSIRAWREGKPVETGTKQTGLTQYAEAPILNSDQLVTTWKQSVQPGNRWDRQTVPVKVSEPGVYLVEAVNKDLRAYTILIISELGVVTKTMPGRLIAFVANRQTGAPAANCEVHVWGDADSAEMYRTNDQGIIDLKRKKPEAENLNVLARAGQNVAIASLYSMAFDDDPSRHGTAYVYTDRPVYRPGHAVHFRAIVRTQQESGYVLPPMRNAVVEIEDPDGKSVYKKTLSINQYGSVSGDFNVPNDAALGYYSLMVRLGEADERGSGFYVEEYRKPEYEVRVTPETSRVIQGEKVRVTFDARYYYGEPVARAKVKYVVHQSRYWYPRYYDADEAQDSSGDDTDMAGDQTDEQTGTLDNDGKLTVEIPTSVSEQKTDVRYRIEARVTDEGGREIAGASSVIATYGSFMVNIAPEQYVVSPGAAAGFKLETRDYNDQPVPAKVHVEFTEWIRQPGKGSAQFVSSPAGSTDVSTDAQGRGRATFVFDHAGSYHARAIATGPGPRPVQDLGYVWVTGSAAWSSGNDETIQLVPDRKEYKPGDTAKVLVITSVPSAKILLTTESRGVSSVRVVPASGPTVTVDVPIKPESVPNFFVSASFFSGGRYHFGQKLLRVPASDKQLAVQLTAPKSTYKPGEPAQVTVEAKDSAGKPVQGEFSIGVVDEAIYAIRNEIATEMLPFFYGHAENYVATDNSLQYYFTGEAGKRRIQLALSRPRTRLAQLKPERLVQPKVRKAFPDTVFWSANVITNADGKATVNLTYPDSLTAWRATARGITTDTKVGSAVLRTVVRKDLLVSLAAPRFFTQGDEITIAALVRNYLPREKTARVSLDVKGLDIVSGSTRDVTVPSRGEAKVEWRLKPQKLREAVLTAKALTDEESDAVELSLPINPQGVKMTNAKAGAISGDKDVMEFDLPLPSQMVAGSRAVELRVTPSVAGAVFGALDYLTSFPYGCTEQTMSSFVPNIVVSKALNLVGVQTDVNRGVLNKKIEAGLQRLYDFQHEDGGWGWWKTDESQIFMTAYVLNGMAQAERAGQAIKPEITDRAAQWLKQALQREPNLLVDLRAYTVYSLYLANAGEPELLDYIWQHRERLTPYGLALFGLALEEAKDGRSAEIATQLESSAQLAGDEASWPNRRDTLLDLFTDTTAETTAHAIKFLVRTKPKSPVLDKAALWLMDHRNDGQWWFTTKQTAMVVYGLTDYLAATGELKPDFKAVVSVNGDEKVSRHFGAEDAFSPKAIVIPVDKLDGTVHVKVERKGTGRLYWNVREDYYAAGEQLASTGNSALTLNREYYKLVPTRVGEKIVHDLVPLSGPVQQGDTLAVKLNLAGNDWRYILVEDPIPSGTEFVTRDDLYELREKPPWWTTWVSRREFHDDHAAIFQSWFRQGQMSSVYLLKVTNPGRFQVSPARVQPMYQPQFFATSKSAVLEVQ